MVKHLTIQITTTLQNSRRRKKQNLQVETEIDQY